MSVLELLFPADLPLHNEAENALQYWKYVRNGWLHTQTRKLKVSVCFPVLNKGKLQIRVVKLVLNFYSEVSHNCEIKIPNYWEEKMQMEDSCPHPKITLWRMQIQCMAGITNALFSKCSPMIYERCTSLWEDNAIWNGPFHKSILLIPNCIQDYYELLNPIMFSSSIDKKKRLCLEWGNDAVIEEQRLKLGLRGFCWHNHTAAKERNLV